MKHRGFTLIEILVVMVIICIVAGIAVLTLSTNQNKQFENLANQLTRIITLGEEEAMLRPATLSLVLTTTTFQFYLFQEPQKTWRALSEQPLGLHHIPSNTQITLKIQDKTIPLDGKPQLIISASGEITPFIILIGKKAAKPFYAVIGEGNGNVHSELFHEQ